MQKILLTGANGFLGSHIVRQLLKQNYQVRALVRKGSNKATIAELPIEYVEGDINDLPAMYEAARGCDAIIHAAVLAQVNPARSLNIWKVNCDGTENILKAAVAINAQRLVYVGTANVCGFGTKQQPGNETFPFAGAKYGSDYMNSKFTATQLVKRYIREQNLPAIITNPTFMFGAMDTKPTSNALLLELYKGKLIGYPQGGKNYVYVGDVAVAIVNALKQGSIGESYILGNENLSYQEVFKLITDIINVQNPRMAIPPTIAKIYGYLSDILAKIGVSTLVNSSMIAIANDGHYFTAEKAIRELSMPQTPISVGISEAFDWFRQHNYVTK
jgi:dihydroflavonol-4-reductase